MKHELLAPAGNLEAGYAALYYGADAVYLGLTKFSARAGADNFTFDELDEFTAYAHALKRKVYVALNTILTEQEIEELPEIIAGLKRTHVDALIIQDLGIFYLVKRLAPEIELHASTQMAVHNLEGARFLQSLGFKRVVLARELTLAEIKKIADALPDLDLEVFIHGALCYSYSGQCLFSALEYGKSANRGCCVYPCRSRVGPAAITEGEVPWGTGILCGTAKNGDKGRNECPAAITEGEVPWGTGILCGSAKNNDKGRNEVENIKGHIFSMKDLALEEQVLQIPALSLKIEGRKKSPLYVAAVTNYYRHILDGHPKNLNEAEDIKQIFSRPWCRFHFNGKNRDVTDEQFVGHRGLLIGHIEQIRGQKLIFKTTRDVARYDGLQIDDGHDEKPYGFGIKALYLNRKPVFQVKAGETAEVDLPEEHPHLTVGAPIYLASSSAVKGRYDYTKPKPHEFKNAQTLPLVVEVHADTIWAMSDDVAVSVHGDFQPAKDANKTIAAVQKAFAKTSQAAICFEDITVVNPNGLFAPASLLNELRRQLVVKLQEKLAMCDVLPILPKIKPYNLTEDVKDLKIFDINLNSKPSDFEPDTLQNAWFRLPQICRQTALLQKVIEAFYEAGVRQFVIENYYGFEVLKKYSDVKIGAGHFLYVMNRYAVAQLALFGCKFATLALESSADNMVEVVKNSPLPMLQIIEDCPPLFTSAVCIRRNDCAHCDHLPKQWRLKSGGREYIVVSRDCQVQLFAADRYLRQRVSGVAFVYQKD